MLDLACVVEKIGVLNVDALCFIFTTSLTLEHVAGLMSSLDVNIFEKIMEKRKSTSRYAKSSLIVGEI